MNIPAVPCRSTGAVIVIPVQIGPDKALKLDIFLPSQGNVKVTDRGLDSDRTPPCDLNGKAIEPGIVVATAMPEAEPLELESRIQEVIETPLYRTTCVLAVPNFMSSGVEFVQFEFEQSDAKAADNTAMKKPEDRIRLEISKRTLNKVGKPILYWLLTDEQGNDRLETIARKHGLFDRDDDATNETLVKIFCAIRSGADTPLLTEPIEEEDDEDEDEDEDE